MRPERGEIKMSVENSVEKSDTVLNRAEALHELGLSDAADDEAVRAAFRTRLKTAHPDVNGGSDHVLRRLILARDLLTAGVKSVSHATERLINAAPVERRLTITLDQAIHGGETTAEVPALEVSAADEELTSLTQMKTLRVPLPAGLRTGDPMSVPTARDVQLFRIHIDGGEVRVWGDDIWMTARIDARLFATGGVSTIETPHGPHEIEVIRDMPRGSSLCLKGLGLPASGERPAGDLHVRLEAAVIPARPLREALDAFRQKWVA